MSPDHPRGRPRASERLRRALGPARRPAERAYRAAVAQSVPRVAEVRLRRSTDPRARGLVDAVRVVRGRGLSSDEAAWARRIEDARQGLVDSGMRGEARVLAIPPEWGRLLMRLAARAPGGRCIELGTGIGISTAYLAAGLELAGRGSVLSLERDPERVSVARGLLGSLALGRAEVRAGRFEESLSTAGAHRGPFDLAFVDTLKNPAHISWCVERLSGALAASGLLALDDVHWSRPVAGAWRRLRRDPRWAFAADLWRLGVLAPAGGGGRADRPYDPPP